MFYLEKYKSKLNKKIIFLSIIAFVFISLFIIPLSFNAGLLEILEESLSGAIASLIRFIANSIAALINKMGLGIDKLVFNVASNFSQPTILKNGNLTLLKNNSLSGQLMNLYSLFVYIGATALGVAGIWITLDFIKTADDVNHKAKLKERLTKFLVSIVLLTSIPTIFDEIMIINQVLIDIFRLVIIDSGAGNSVKGMFLSDIFKAMAQAEKSDIILASIYLISTFINAWLVIFYMIRDLSISLLFIVGPIIAVFLPYNTNLVLKWLKEIISNIFTQAIQALIMAIIILIASSLGKDSVLYDKIFALVAFCSFIPLTATVKRMLGLEGEIGVAKSNAGLGAVMGAIGLAGATYAGIKGTVNKVKDANSDIKNISAEEELMKKSNFGDNQVSTSVSKNNDSNIKGLIGSGNTPNSPSPNGLGGGGRGIGIDPNNRAATNRNYGVETVSDYDNLQNGGYTATSRAKQLEGMKSNAKKQRNRAILGGAMGTLGGAIAGIGSAAYGSPFITMMASKVGAELGNDVGSLAGEKGTEIAQSAKEYAKDYHYGEGIRYDGEQNQALDSLFKDVDFKSKPSEVFNTVKANFNRNRDIIRYNKDDEVGREQANQRATGLDKYSMNPRDYSTENKAILRRNSLERQGKFGKAHRSYARNTYDRNQPYIPSEQITMPGNPKLEGKSDDPILSAGKPIMPIAPPNPPSPSDLEVNQNKKRKEDEINFFEDFYKDLESLDMDVLSYENNNDYLSVLDDIYGQYENPHINNDYGQLS